MDRKLYQKQYDFELEQRNTIASSTNIPIVSITVIGGALSTMVLSFPYSGDLKSMAFIGTIILSVIAVLTSLVLVLRSLIGYTYQKIPSPNALADHHRKLEAWHRENGEQESVISEKADKDFSEYLDQKLAEAAENNSVNNIRRGSLIHDSAVAIAVALGFLVVAAPVYIRAKVSHADKIQQVRIIEPISVIPGGQSMAENENGTDNPSGQPAQPEQKPAQPIETKPKPSGPLNTEFRSGTDSVGRKIEAIIKGSPEGSGEKE